MNKQLYKYPEKIIDLMFDKLVKEIEQNDNRNYKHYQTKLQLIMNIKQKIKQSNNIEEIRLLEKEVEYEINNLLKHHDDNRIIISNYTSSKIIQLLKNNFTCKIELINDSEDQLETNIWKVINPYILDIKIDKEGLYLTIKSKYEHRIKVTFDYFGKIGVYNQPISREEIINNKPIDPSRFDYFIFLDTNYNWNCELLTFNSLNTLIDKLFGSYVDFELV